MRIQQSVYTQHTYLRTHIYIRTCIHTYVHTCIYNSVGVSSGDLVNIIEHERKISAKPFSSDRNDRLDHGFRIRVYEVRMKLLTGERKQTEIIK